MGKKLQWMIFCLVTTILIGVSFYLKFNQDFSVFRGNFLGLEAILINKNIYPDKIEYVYKIKNSRGKRFYGKLSVQTQSSQGVLGKKRLIGSPARYRYVPPNETTPTFNFVVHRREREKYSDRLKVAIKKDQVVETGTITGHSIAAANQP